MVSKRHARDYGVDNSVEPFPDIFDQKTYNEIAMLLKEQIFATVPPISDRNNVIFSAGEDDRVMGVFIHATPSRPNFERCNSAGSQGAWRAEKEGPIFQGLFSYG
ncbi:MAG TPA: hypothetical protein PKE26_05575 [Kiritimatiellia bacterium]|nr:hypothetical protein [Kiritimatiellia bacterium]HMO98563.1 hypothetical protein [Kiritimatiellia bacterium]HMP97605.1 hypothetical protein [Kiritimatiellia bacterium]